MDLKNQKLILSFLIENNTPLFFQIYDKKSAPRRTRTSDLRYRKPSLYPAEPWAPSLKFLLYQETSSGI